MNGEIDYIALGTRIRQLREKEKLTQEKLAEVCSLSAAHIGHIERGTRIPSLDTVFKIAKTLHIGIDVLLMDSYDETDKSLYNFSNIVKNREKLNLKDLISNTRMMIDEIDSKI